MDYNPIIYGYDKRFTKQQVIDLYSVGITPDKISFEKQDFLFPQLIKVRELINYVITENQQLDDVHVIKLSLYSFTDHSIILKGD